MLSPPCLPDTRVVAQQEVVSCRQVSHAFELNQRAGLSHTKRGYSSTCNGNASSSIVNVKCYYIRDWA